MPGSDDVSWHDAMPLAELEDSEPREFQLGSRLLALVKIGEKVYAVDCICTHEFAMLSDGYVEDGAIECPLHAARFDLATGKVIDGPTEKELGTYPARVSGDMVQIGLPRLGR